LSKSLSGIIATVALFTTGCSSNSQQQLASEINRLTKVGDSLRTATTTLESEGFKCGDKYLSNFAPGEVICGRNRNYYVVSTCLQRVIISADKPRAKVTELNVQPPSCAGL